MPGRRHVHTSCQWQYGHAQASQPCQRALLSVTQLSALGVGQKIESSTHSCSTVTSSQDHFIGFSESFCGEFCRHHATLRCKRCRQPTGGCWCVPRVLVLVFPEPAADALVSAVGPLMKGGARHRVSCQVVYTRVCSAIEIGLRYRERACGQQSCQKPAQFTRYPFSSEFF